jgi:hypothetical protein
MTGSNLHAAPLAILLAALAAPASAQTPQIRPGLWEIAISGLPKKQTTCFTPAMVTDVQNLAQRGQQASDCKSSNARTTGNTHTVEISCTKPNRYDAKVTTTVNGPDNFTVTQDYTAGPAGKAQQGRLTMSYRRLGDCK